MSSKRELLQSLIGRAVGLGYCDGSYSIDLRDNDSFHMDPMVIKAVSSDLVHFVPRNPSPKHNPLIEESVALDAIRGISRRGQGT